MTHHLNQAFRRSVAYLTLLALSFTACDRMPGSATGQETGFGKTETEKREPSVPLLKEFDTKQKGLIVTCPAKIPLKGENAGKVPVRVYNMLGEDVFLDVSEQELGCALDLWAEGGWSGGSWAGGGMVKPFPGEAGLHWRLNSGYYKDSRAVFYGHSDTVLSGKLDPEVLSKGRARGTVTVNIYGFYRKTGKSFSESIELPIELVEEEADKNDR